VSGLTSIIKATLALEHKIIPPTRGIETLSPELKLVERNIEIVQQPRPWPAGKCERISVNAFGYGGANAHAIVDAATSSIAEINDMEDPSAQSMSVLLPLSAHHPDSMAANVQHISTLQVSSSELLDVAYTLSQRSRLAYRGYMIGTWTRDGTRFSQASTLMVPSTLRSNAFAFTGQGAQWSGMGRELLHRFPKYRDVICDLDLRLRSLTHAPSWTIMETLLEDAAIGSIYKADRSQTVCTAVQIALVELLKDFGVQPAAVVGHSSGEIGAAFAAGYISAPEALAIAYYRGFVSQKIPIEGAMLAVGLSADLTNELLSSLGVQSAANVACVNSPESTTVSGEPHAVAAIVEALNDRKVFNRKLNTDGKAYHSHLMKLVEEEYQHLLEGVFEHPSSPAPYVEIQMFSSLTEQLATRQAVRTPEYWAANLTSPVLFKQALELMLKSGQFNIVEIGPHPVLGQSIKDTAKSAVIDGFEYHSSLHRGKPDETCILQLLGRLFMAGIDLDISKINKVDLELPGPDHTPKELFVRAKRWAASAADDSGFEDLSDRSERSSSPDIRDLGSANRPQYCPKIFTSMPTYSWYHQAPLWAESRVSAEFRNTKYRKHDLLGWRLPATPGSLAIWRNQLRLADAPWIQHHRLGSTIVFPAAGYISMAIEALLQLHDHPSTGSVVIRHMHLMNMLVLSTTEKEAIELSTVLEPEETSITTVSKTWWRFQISTYAAGSCTVHAKGRIGIKSNRSNLVSSIPLPTAFAAEEQATRTMYNRLAAQGLSFGPLFQSMESISTDRHRKVPFAEAKVSFHSGGDPATMGYSAYVVHPITIDSLLQTAIVASCKGITSELYGKVPVQIGNLEMLLEGLSTPSALCSVRASSTKVGFDAVQLAGELEDLTGRIVLKTTDVRAINYKETSLAPKSTLQRNPALRVLWKPDITTITPSSDAAREYARRFRQYIHPDWVKDGSSIDVAAMLDLLAHKYGRMNILELGEESDTSFADLVAKLSLSHAPRKYRSYTRAAIDSSGEIRVHGSNSAYTGSAFDLVIVPSPGTLSPVCKSLVTHLNPNGWLIAARAECEHDKVSGELSHVTSVISEATGDTIVVERKVGDQAVDEAIPSGHILLVSPILPQDADANIQSNQLRSTMAPRSVWTVF
jgi:acyl transferase domain-containing protein